MTTPICERLGIEFPLFAFSHCRDVVAAVSKAGGYGVLGALAFSPDQLEIELNWIDDNIDGKLTAAEFRNDPMWFTDYMRRSTVEWDAAHKVEAAE